MTATPMYLTVSYPALVLPTHHAAPIRYLYRNSEGQGTLPRLDDVKGRQPGVDARKGNGGEQPVCPPALRSAGACDGGASCRGRRHSVTAPRTTPGSRSISRRTNRHGTAARRQASTIASS